MIPTAIAWGRSEIIASAAWWLRVRWPLESPEERRAMGAAGRRWVAEHYSLDVTGPAWAEALGLSVPVESAGGPAVVTER